MLCVKLDGQPGNGIYVFCERAEAKGTQYPKFSKRVHKEYAISVDGTYL